MEENTAQVSLEINTDEPALTSIEEITRDQVDKVKERFAALGEPLLTPLPYRARYEEGLPFRMEAPGYFQVMVDQRALGALFEGCDLTAEEYADVELSIRAATIADRDFSGGVIGEISIDNTVEVYSSLPMDIGSSGIDAKLKRFRRWHIPFSRQSLANFMVHELRHVIQKKKKMFTESAASFFAKDNATHDSYDYEKDAIHFAEQLEKQFEQFVSIEPYDIADFYQEYGDVNEAKRKFGGLAQYMDWNVSPAYLTEKDPPGVRLFDRSKKYLEGEGILNTEEVETFMMEVNRMRELGKIGFEEQRYLLKKLGEAGKNFGNYDVVQSVRFKLEAFEKYSAT